MSLSELLLQISGPNEPARAAAHARWQSLAKPLGGLGFLEDALEKVAALSGDADCVLSPRTALVMCADNGVVAQGVTQTGSSVTAQVTRNMARGLSSVSHMAALAACRVQPVDMGIVDFPPCDGVLSRRVGNATADISLGTAMSLAQAEQAVLFGIELAREEAAKGTRLLLTGEMGIGNTTTASALCAVLLALPVERVTGKGAGLTNAALSHKISVVKQAITINKPNPSDPLSVLAKLGGFDIAGLVGVFLGGALCRVPVLVDGFISAVAALVAMRLCPASRCAMLASHVSAEPAGTLVLEALGLTPLITAGMHLGEGTGAVAALPLLDMARAVYCGLPTFEELEIAAYKPL